MTDKQAAGRAGDGQDSGMVDDLDRTDCAVSGGLAVERAAGKGGSRSERAMSVRPDAELETRTRGRTSTRPIPCCYGGYADLRTDGRAGRRAGGRADGRPGGRRPLTHSSIQRPPVHPLTPLPVRPSAHLYARRQTGLLNGSGSRWRTSSVARYYDAAGVAIAADWLRPRPVSAGPAVGPSRPGGWS